VAVKLDVYEIFCSYRLTSITHVLKMPGKTSGVSYPRQNEGENLHQYMSVNTFRYTATTFTQHQFSIFLPVETLKNHGVLSTNCKWWDISPSHLLCPSNHSVCNRPGEFEKVEKHMIRYVHACTDSGWGYSEYLLWIMTW
jgi:hypothetical protein